MKCLKWTNAAGILVMLIMLAGCGGITGTTQHITIAPTGVLSTRDMQLKSLRLEENGAELINIMSYRWGKFSDEDLQTLDASLRTSLQAAQERKELKSPPLTLEVVVRRHLVAHSNNNAAVLACVAWCARLNNAYLYHEQFYASAKASFARLTVGAVKDDVTERIVSRIVKSAVLLANGQTSASLPISTEGTYMSFKDAIEPLPKSLTASPPPGYVYVQGNPTGKVPWSWAEPATLIRWEIPKTSSN